MEKPLRQIFTEFRGEVVESSHGVDNTGDVKYHLGASNNRIVGGREIRLSVAANPSHLEAVNPVAGGKTRAKQHLAGGDLNAGLSVLIHGDAAFAGQGIVPETLAFSDLTGYSVGGPSTLSSTTRSASRRTPPGRAPPPTVLTWPRWWT